MVGYVRRHSKDEKLTRPLRETHNFRRARYKNTCQRRFDAQRKMMGSKTIVEISSSDSEDSDDILGDMWDDDKSSDDAELKVTVNKGVVTQQQTREKPFFHIFLI